MADVGLPLDWTTATWQCSTKDGDSFSARVSPLFNRRETSRTVSRTLAFPVLAY